MGTTTLIILDAQQGIIESFGNTDGYVERLSSTLAAARNNNIRVIHVITAFRPGYPESHPHNSSIVRVAASGRFQEGDASTEHHPAIAPINNEVVITKRRVSAFFGTELDMILRCYNTERVVIAGLVTSGAVLSTVRSAFDLDYRITVLQDGCMDRDEDVHHVLIEKIFKGKADTVTCEEWIENISARPETA